MDSINGYGTLTEGDSSTSAVDTAAKTFITGGLSKVMKINNICDNEHLEDCGIASKITTLGGSQIDIPTTMGELNSQMVGSYSTRVDSMSLLDTKAAAFETQNGESIILYYNPNCVGSFNEDAKGNGGVYIAPKVCANFVYDLNGNKGPNTVGKDIGFMTAMYPTDVKVVAPYPATQKLSSTYAITPTSGVSASKACTDYDSEYRLPNIDELASMAVNKNLLNGSTATFTGLFWSSSRVYNTQLNKPMQWLVNLSSHIMDDLEPFNAHNVWCIKR